MAKKVLNINKYEGGLNSYSDPRDLKENEFQALDNACVDEQGIIRVSGGFELKETGDAISGLSVPSGKGLFSTPSDYYVQVNEGSFNTYLDSDEEDDSSAWGITHSNANATWKFSQYWTNTNNNGLSTFGYIDTNGTFAISYATYADGNSYDHGSIKYSNISLTPGNTYRLIIKCISELPWFYLGSNIPPRVRIYNDDASLYYYPGGFQSTSDASQTAIMNTNLSNLVDSPDSSDATAGGNIVYSSDGRWDATGSALIKRIQVAAAAPVGSSAQHAEYNSLFGEEGATGTLTNGYMLELTGAASSSGTWWTSGNFAYSSDLTVVAETTYLLDGFFLTVDEQISVRILDRTASPDVTIIESLSLASESKWQHISGNTNAPTPIEFTTPSSCTAIRIEIGVNDTGDVAYFAGFNIRKKLLELQYMLENPEMILYQNFIPAIGYPNSWRNLGDVTAGQDGTVNSPYLSPGSSVGTGYANFISGRTRTYQVTFTVPSGSLHENRWNISLETGKFGQLEANDSNWVTTNNFVVTSVQLLSNADNEDILLTTPYSSGKTNFLFYQLHDGNSTSVHVKRYNASENTYTDTEYDLSLPSTAGKTNYVFTQGSNEVFFCDENFGDKNLYRFKYNKKESRNILNVVSFNGPNITAFSNSASDGLATGYYSSVSDYLSQNDSNDMYIPMISEFFHGLTNEIDSDVVGEEFTLPAIGDKFNQFSGNLLSLTQEVTGGGAWNEVGDNPLGAPLTAAFKGMKYHVNSSDFSVSWEDDQSVYTKYITIPSYQIAENLNDTRIGKIEIDLSHVIYCTTPSEILGVTDDLDTDYIPEMDIYVDVVHDNVHTFDGSSHTGTLHASPVDDISANFIANIKKVEVNPNHQKIGDTGNDPVTGLAYKFHSGGQVNVYFQNNAPSETQEGNAYLCPALYSIKYLNHTHQDMQGKYPYRIEIPIDFTESYQPIDNGSAVNLTVHSTTGVNLQLRFVPKIKGGAPSTIEGNVVGGNQALDFWNKGIFYTVGGYGIRAHGLFAESWKIEDIRIRSYSTGQTVDTSGGFSNLGVDDIQANIGFETPTEGEADGWNDDWELFLTSVNDKDIESTFGDSTPIVTNTDVTKCPAIAITLRKDNPILMKYKLIKGYMKSKRNQNYNLQFIIDIDRNIVRSSTSPQEITAHESGNIKSFSIPSKNLLIPNEINSYESETGLNIESVLNESNMKATYKTAVIANGSMYAGNVYQNGIHYPDRMLKSPIGKVPMLPSTSFIDVAINDGDDIVSLQFYKDKLLQFKRKKVYIISTSEEFEFLEDTIENVGVKQESQITMTPYGIAWINPRGCYLYDGSKFNNLTENKIAYKNWKDTESSWEINESYGPIMTYLRKEDKLLIYGASENLETIKDREDSVGGYGDIYGGRVGEYAAKEYLRKTGYQYDFQTKSWSMLTAWNEDEDDLSILNLGLDGRVRVPSSTNTVSNFVYDENGNSMVLIEPFGKFIAWDDNPKQTTGHLNIQNVVQSTSSTNEVNRDFRVITKDYDFGAPSVNKKIYKMYVTFKSTEKESNKDRKLVQNQDLYSTSNVGVYYAINGTNNWTEFSETKSENYGTKGLVSDDSETTTTLSSGISSVGTSLTVASASNIKVGYVLKINDEQMIVKSISGTTITVGRGYNNSSDLNFSFFGVHDSGDTVNISKGDWIVAELRPSSSINNIDSIKFKFETKERADLSETQNDENGVPAGFMINDISLVYRIKNAK